jgi:hypothetical protein
VCLVLFPFDSCFECIFISLYFYFSITPSNNLFLPMGFLPVLQGSVLSFFFPYSPFFTTAESPTRHSNQPSFCPVALPTGEAGCGGVLVLVAESSHHASADLCPVSSSRALNPGQAGKLRNSGSHGPLIRIILFIKYRLRSPSYVYTFH